MHLVDHDTPLALADAAKVLGVTQQALRKACERGRLHGVGAKFSVPREAAVG